MRLKKLFVILFALLGGRSLFAGVCEEFTEFQTPYTTLCFKMWSISWIAFGNGWKTTVRGANLSDGIQRGVVQFTWAIFPAVPYAPDGHYINLTAIFTDNRTAPLGVLQQGLAGGIILSSGNSTELNLLYTLAGCDKYGEYCSTDIPDPAKLSVGRMSVGYMARIGEGAPASLRGLPKPSVQFNHVSGLQATEPAFDPSPLWRVPVSATVDGKQTFSFAVNNPFKEDVVVKGTLINQKGITLGVQSWSIPGTGTVAMFLTNPKSGSDSLGFGQDPFPNGKNFTGWLELRVVSPSTGLVSVVGLQYTNGGMSSADVQPFYSK